MVPPYKEPMIRGNTFVNNIVCYTFAQQSKTITQKPTTMKNNSTQVAMNTPRKESKRKKQMATQKRIQAEANARRKVAKSWDVLGHSTKYRKAAAKESCARTTRSLEYDVFDGLLLNLSGRNSVKSFSFQKRIIRRIVEKRQAQSVHRRVGRTTDRFASHILRHCASKSLCDLWHYQLCA